MPVNGGGIIPPKDQIVIEIDNATGQCTFASNRPLPFWYVAHIVCKLVGQMGDAQAASLGAPFQALKKEQGVPQ